MSARKRRKAHYQELHELQRRLRASSWLCEFLKEKLERVIEENRQPREGYSFRFEARPDYPLYSVKVICVMNDNEKRNTYEACRQISEFDLCHPSIHPRHYLENLVEIIIDTLRPLLLEKCVMTDTVIKELGPAFKRFHREG